MSRLTTADVAEMVGVNPTTLGCNLTRQWATWLRGQPERVGQGTARWFRPIDAVVVDMLVSTMGLAGDLCEEVRDQLAEQLYEAWDAHQADMVDLPVTLDVETPGANLIIGYQPPWFLTTRKQAA